MIKNLLNSLPNNLQEEAFEDLIKTDSVRIERIVSHGHSSPETGWYDQDEHEWVMVLEGFGVLEFESGECITLEQGDSLNIPAHKKHKVKQTSKQQPTIWLAVFYK
ncbi:MAG: cupin [Pseudoalteromonas sp.]|nr:cupin [Pseudoalteromonas sp.]|tara:strand:- start:1624 stop:1941 length:318 start_codon:yes stop_codon:yes gene_type:complete